MPSTIEVLVYSGRANPRVEIDAATEAELARRVSALEPLGHAFVPGDGLGYRGLQVAGTSASAMRELEVSAGGVRVHERDGRTRDLADDDRALERWLLGLLGARVAAADQPLVADILRQLDERGSRAPRRGVSPDTSPDTNNEHRTMANKREQAPAVVGTWTKATTAACADKYPATLTFSTGTYRGTRGPGQGMVWWDAGIYRLEDPGKLVVGTATDELVTYQIEVQADHFDVTDSEGCRVTYRRQTR
jgi:hypothetical protein